jgi:hypothetical protein
MKRRDAFRKKEVVTEGAAAGMAINEVGLLHIHTK